MHRKELVEKAIVKLITQHIFNGFTESRHVYHCQ